MKSIILTFTLLHFILVASIAQTSVWKVTGNGNTLYLGGTIHVLRTQDYPLPSQYDSIFNRVNALVFEANIEELEKPEAAQKLMSRAMYTDEKTLQTVLTPKAYQVLYKACSEYSLPIANLAKFKPSLVILTIMGLKLQKMGLAITGIDKHFLELAKTQKKELLYLETAEEQMDLLAEMGKGNESDFVIHSLKDLEKEETEIPAMIAALKSGSPKIFEEQADSMKKDYPALYQSLLVDRNNKWMPIIEQYLKTAPIEFVLAGALHMHGKDGLLKLLSDKGYKVEQL